MLYIVDLFAVCQYLTGLYSGNNSNSFECMNKQKHKMKFYSIVLAILCAFPICQASDWSYGDYSTWGGICQTGKKQSPIDLVPSKAEDRLFSAFAFHDYEKSYPGKVKNNGHSIQITLEKSTTGTPRISGGGLIGEYVLDHIHFHWLSEHTVNGYSFPLEMHLVHYSSRVSNLTQAAELQAVAVLGVFFEFSLDDDEDFIPLIEVMDKVERFPARETPLERTISPKSFIPRHTSDYFRYQGSLTTPDCNEGVIWTVFEKPLPISADQYTHFEMIWSEEGPLSINFRPVQPLNGRTVGLRHSPVRVYGNTATIQHKAVSVFGLSSFIILLQCLY